MRAIKLYNKLLQEAPYRKRMYDRYTADAIPIKTEKLPPFMEQEIRDFKKPDRRCINHFEKEIVDTKTGYFSGKPVIVTNYTAETNIDGYIDDFNISFNYEDTFSELTADASATGRGGVLLYKRDGDPKVLRLDPWSFFVAYDRDLPLDAVRVYTDEDDREVLEYYTSTLMQVYIKEKTEWIPREPVLHGFGRVPIVEVLNNRMGYSDYHSSHELIDAYNRLVSDFSNEVEAFRLAYMLLVNLSLNDEDLRRLRQTGAIQLDKDSDVRFVSKDIQVNAITTLKDLLEKNIARFSGHVVFTSTDFTGNLTRIAVQYKLQPLEQKAHTFELKFRNFLREFYAVYFSYAGLNFSYDAGDLVFQFTRTVPVNLAEEIDAFIKLDGHVSEDTRMGMTSFINNPEDEQRRMIEEKNLLKEADND